MSQNERRRVRSGALQQRTIVERIVPASCNNTARLVTSRKVGAVYGEEKEGRGREEEVIKFCNKHSSGAATHFGNAETGGSRLERPADTRNSRSETLNFGLGRETNFCRVLAYSRPCIFTHRGGIAPADPRFAIDRLGIFAPRPPLGRKIRGIYV